jgi:hypothetical protein
MRQQNVGLAALLRIRVHRRAINRVTARWISTVGPVNQAILAIEFQIDRFRQAIIEKFDVGAVGRGLPLRDIDLRAKDATLSRIVRSFLRPMQRLRRQRRPRKIDFSMIWIDGDTHTPFCQVGAGALFAVACVDQSFDV